MQHPPHEDEGLCYTLVRRSKSLNLHLCLVSSHLHGWGVITKNASIPIHEDEDLCYTFARWSKSRNFLLCLMSSRSSSSLFCEYIEHRRNLRKQRGRPYTIVYPDLFLIPRSLERAFLASPSPCSFASSFALFSLPIVRRGPRRTSEYREVECNGKWKAERYYKDAFHG